MGKANSIMDISETGNFNIAKGYAFGMIYEPIKKMNYYYELAKFGTDDIVESFLTTPEMKDKCRIEAMQRFIHSAKILISNTMFALKNEKDKENLNEIRKAFDSIEKMLPLIELKTFNQRDKRVYSRIDEVQFNKIYPICYKLKEEVVKPLNRNDLIFINPEEFDPDEYLRQWEEDYVNSG